MPPHGVAILVQIQSCLRNQSLLDYHSTLVVKTAIPVWVLTLFPSFSVSCVSSCQGGPATQWILLPWTCAAKQSVASCLLAPPVPDYTHQPATTDCLSYPGHLLDTLLAKWFNTGYTEYSSEHSTHVFISLSVSRLDPDHCGPLWTCPQPSPA